MLTTAELNRLAKNTGCEKYHDCLTCPFSKCIYDTDGSEHMHTRVRYERIWQMHPAMTVKKIAEQLGITRRTVYRALKEKSNGQKRNSSN